MHVHEWIIMSVHRYRIRHQRDLYPFRTLFWCTFELVKFLCGRPGCGQDSTATLQIDAASSTVSLVDPRTSRDGVPLCARHSDATTPPVGWAMNDLRTTAGVVIGVTDREAGITAAPPRVRPEQNGEQGPARKMSRRQSIVERARQEAAELQDEIDATVVDERSERDLDEVDDLSLLDGEARERLVNAKLAERATRRGGGDSGPNSRPSRRRAAEKPATTDEDGFPWTFHLDEDDEPEELQASTPLLSRAFRASTG